MYTKSYVDSLPVYTKSYVDSLPVYTKSYVDSLTLYTKSYEESLAWHITSCVDNLTLCNQSNEENLTECTKSYDDSTYIAVLNSAKMQQSPSLFSHFHGKVGLPHSNFDYIKACTDFLTAIPSECTIYRPRFHFVLQFQIVSNTVTTHHLRSLFSFILCSSKSF